jgi:hypothetical protein
MTQILQPKRPNGVKELPIIFVCFVADLQRSSQGSIGSTHGIIAAHPPGNTPALHVVVHSAQKRSSSTLTCQPCQPFFS